MEHGITVIDAMKTGRVQKIIMLIGLLVFAQLTSAGDKAPVGWVLMQIGKAWVQHKESTKLQDIVRAMPLYEGDEITTASSGVLQLKMYDDARLMVQPDTKLQIQKYHYAPAEPRLNRIRLKVVKGKVRWITGKAGHFNKAGFRLNTPVAAIGIRGTDFETRVFNKGTTRIRLYSGAVVVSPFSDTCAVNAYGPCGGQNALVVDERLKGAVVEVRPGYKKPVVRKLHQKSGSKGGDAVAPPEKRDDAVAVLPRILPGHELAEQSSELQWGRYASTNLPWPTPDVLMKDGWVPRVTTAHLLLFSRDGFTGYPRGKASFALKAAEAYLFTPDMTPERLVVKSGGLHMDFDRRNFTTSLTLHNATGAEQQYDASGALRSGGLFFSEHGSMQVKGTVDKSVQEAAYLFTTPETQQGAVEGATYWQIK